MEAAGSTGSKYDPIAMTQEMVRFGMNYKARVMRLAKIMSEHAKDVKMQKLEGGQMNLFAEFGDGEGRPLVIATHNDPVYATDKGWTNGKAFGGEIIERDGKKFIQGRGSADPYGAGMGALAALMEASDNLSKYRTTISKGDNAETIADKTGLSIEDAEAVYTLQNNKIVMAFTGYEETDSRGADIAFNSSFWDRYDGIEGIVSPDIMGYDKIFIAETGRTETKITADSQTLVDKISKIGKGIEGTHPYLLAVTETEDASNATTYTIERPSGHLEIGSGEKNVFNYLMEIAAEAKKAGGKIIFAKAEPDKTPEGLYNLTAPDELTVTVEGKEAAEAVSAYLKGAVQSDPRAKYQQKKGGKRATRGFAYVSQSMDIGDSSESKTEELSDRLSNDSAYEINRDFRKHDYSQPFETDPKSDLVRKVVRAAHRAGKRYSTGKMEGVSDNNVLLVRAKEKYGQESIPVAIVGTGKEGAKGLHDVDEEESVDAIYRVKTTYRNILGENGRSEKRTKRKHSSAEPAGEHPLAERREGPGDYIDYEGKTPYRSAA